MKLEELRKAYADAQKRTQEAAEAIENAPEDISDEDLEELNKEFDEAKAEEDEIVPRMRRAEIVAEARKATIVVPEPEPVVEEERTEIRVTKNESVYRPDGEHSFFSDIYKSRMSPAARERLERNRAEVLDHYRQQTGEERVVTGTTDGQFIPPIYLASEWVDFPRAGRPFADKVPTMPFPAEGLTMTIPKQSGGVSEAVQQQNGSVSSTDITVTTVTAPMVTIAGQQDVARQLLERSLPGLDVVIYRDLMKAYNVQLDSQLLSGTGSSGQHLGLRAVSSVNTVTYNDTSPTGGALLPKVYDAAQKIATTRFMPADMIVMHPRRAAWLAATQSSSFPIFQQGGLFHAVGTQDQGFVGTFAGLPVLQDPNVTTTQGASTNQDEIYVIHSGDFLLAEGPLREAAYEEVLSGNLAIRLQLFGYSFYFAGRYEKSITIISGTGLVTPTF